MKRDHDTWTLFKINQIYQKLVTRDQGNYLFGGRKLTYPYPVFLHILCSDIFDSRRKRPHEPMTP